VPLLRAAGLASCPASLRSRARTRWPPLILPRWTNPIGWSQECTASNEGFERASATPNECNARCRQGSDGSGNKFSPAVNRSVATGMQLVIHTGLVTRVQQQKDDSRMSDAIGYYGEAADRLRRSRLIGRTYTIRAQSGGRPISMRPMCSPQTMYMNCR